MNETKKCPNCGKILDTHTPEGLCPACLLNQSTNEDTYSRVPFEPPEPAQLVALFPQLEILELIGKGGMGAVYKARQKALDRLVALKILPSDTCRDPGFSERFTREARALAKLNHRNIVTVYEYGEAGGFLFFIMEYVDGLNLRQLEHAGTLEPHEALAIVPQICEALQYAHDEGVIHRDIKPGNILIDKKGRVKIADFGIAKIMGKPADQTLTGSRDVMGTPHYIAPEQVEHPQDVDHRADIYSLGVVFYELLTGELPLGRFASPSHKVHVDVRLDKVVLRALEKEPELRYQHAIEMKTDVETISSTPASNTAQAERKATVNSDACSRALRQVRWPAIGLIVSSLSGPFMLGIMVATGKIQPGAWMLVPFILQLILVVLAALGGWKMLHLESRWMALAGAIAGCVGSFFNLLCLPFSVWSLAVLSRREVREAFESTAK